MKRIVSLLSTVAMVAAIVYAQSGRYSRSSANNEVDRYPKSAKIVVQADGGFNASSLEQLVTSSPLIIEGTVASILRTFQLLPEAPHLIQTDSMVSVDDVLKGEIPRGMRTILLSQPGGRIGDFEVEVEGAPVVVRDERYMSFLVPDDRMFPEDTSRLNRYAVRGLWAGMMKIGPDDSVRALKGAKRSLAEEVKKYKKGELRVEIDRITKGKHTSTDKLPIHPGGPRLP